MDCLHGTRPRPALEQIQANLSQKIRFKSGQLNGACTKVRTPQARTSVVQQSDRYRAKRKIFEASVAQHGADELQTSAAPSVAGSVKQKPNNDADLDMQECRLSSGIVGACSTCILIALMCNSRRTLDTTESIGSVLGGNPVSENCTHLE